MSLSIAQDYEYVGNGYWNWRAWIEGTTAELASVRRVKWLLHPSFTPSVVESTDRESNFRLETSGWGTFVLRAELERSDGSVTPLRHMLELAYPQGDTSRWKALRGNINEQWGKLSEDELDLIAGNSDQLSGKLQEVYRISPAEAERQISEWEARRPPGARARDSEPPGAQASPPKVFLSYGAEDRKAALGLRRTLESLGLKVLDDSNISMGDPWELALRNLQSAADATIAYVSSDTPSAFVVREVNESMRSGKPTLVIATGDLENITGVDPAVRVSRTSIDDVSAISLALSELGLPAK